MKRLSRNDIETISEKFVKAYFELPEIKKSQVYRIEPGANARKGTWTDD